MSSNPDDSKLFEAFQQRESVAENAVFKRFFRPLVLYAERITGHMPQARGYRRGIPAKGLGPAPGL